MVRDNKNNIHTDIEFRDKRIDKVQVNIRDTQDLMKRLDSLVISLERQENVCRFIIGLKNFIKKLNSIFQKKSKT